MIRAFKEEDTETVIRIWLAASVRSHSFIDKAYWEEKAEAMRTLYLPLSEIVVDEDRATGEVVAFMAFVEDYLAALFVAPAHQKRGVGSINGSAFVTAAGWPKKFNQPAAWKAKTSSVPVP